MFTDRLINKIKLKKMNRLDVTSEENELVLSFVREASKNMEGIDVEYEIQKKMFYDSIGKIPSDDIKAIAHIVNYIEVIVEKVRLVYINKASDKTIERYAGICSFACHELLPYARRLKGFDKDTNDKDYIGDSPEFDEVLENGKGRKAFDYWYKNTKLNLEFIKKVLKERNVAKIYIACHNFVSLDIVLCCIWE